MGKRQRNHEDTQAIPGVDRYSAPYNIAIVYSQYTVQSAADTDHT